LLAFGKKFRTNDGAEQNRITEPVFGRFLMRRLLALGVVLAAANLWTQAGGEKQPPTIPDLIQQLSSKDFHLRQQAAVQLGNLGLAAREAVPGLAKLLHDVAPEVRQSAAKALGQIGKPAVPALTEALRDRDADARKNAARTLARLGSDAVPAVPALSKALKDHEVSVRASAAYALGEIGPAAREAAPALARALRDSAKSVRNEAALALGQIGPEATKPLGALVHEEDPAVRIEALRVLELFGPQAKEALPDLRQALQDSEPRVRAKAADVIGRIGKEAQDAVPELLANLQVKKMEVQVASANALVILSMQGVPGLLQKVRAADRKGQWAEPLIFRQFGPVPADAVNGLIRELENKDARVRAKAVLLLAQFGEAARPAVPALTRALKDPDEQVKVLAAVSLARIERKPLDNLEGIQNVVRQQALVLNQAGQRQMLAAQGGGVAVQVGGVPVAGMQVDGPNPQQLMLAAMADFALQAAYRQWLMFYVAVVVHNQATNAPLSPFDFFLDSQISLLGPQAIPALVDVINMVVTHRIGYI
jgi:HEAT repeat protein